MSSSITCVLSYANCNGEECEGIDDAEQKELIPFQKARLVAGAQ